MTSVLVSGAGIAGLALAHWLRRNGCEPTVVERAPALRPGGQAVDVRGVALDVLDRMGLLDEVRAARTRMRGMSMYDAEGNELWSTTEMTYSGGRFDSGDIEVLRDDLTAILYRRAREDGVEFLFGDAIAALDEHSDGFGEGPDGVGGVGGVGGVRGVGGVGSVEATFDSGHRRTFDLVVGADGLRSRVRHLAFPEEAHALRHLGAYVGVFSTDNFPGLDDWQVWLQSDRASYCLYPVRGNTQLRATLGFLSPPLDTLDAMVRRDPLGTEVQKELLASHMAPLGGETPRLLEAMRAAPDFYFDAMAQVRMDSWSTGGGRITLVGDAGYCGSPLSGQGTSLALTGAYVLAEELGRDVASTDGPGPALRRYEQRMRPFAELNQALATENPGQGASEESLERAKGALDLEAVAM